MKTCAALLAVLALAGFAANAQNFSSTGYSDQTTIIEPEPDDCAGGHLSYNHDDSFENGYCWQYGGTVPPYYGAFGEGYSLGRGGVICGAFWLTQLGYFNGRPADLYVWEGGVTAPPGLVEGVVFGQVFQNIATWPLISRHVVNMYIGACGEFTIGYWADFSAETCQWFCAADQNGFGGHPWTNVAPGMGYPTGWQDPSPIWGPTQSLGFGSWFDPDFTCGSPVEAETWGSIKSLFE